MRYGLFFRFFPPPRFLARPTVGLDLSDRSLKFFELYPHGQAFRIRRCGEHEVPTGLIEAGRIKEPQKLSDFLRELNKKLKLEFIVASLPEEQAYVFSLRLPKMRLDQLRPSVELQLEEHVPIPPVEAVFDYEILSQPDSVDEHFYLGVSVLPRSLVDSYAQVFTMAGFRPLAFEIEAQAIVRSVVPWRDDSTRLVIDIGKMRTSFFVASGGAVIYTSTISNIGGEAITQAVKKGLELDYKEAERLKIEQGILPQPNDRRMLFAVLPVLSVLRDETIKVLNYWQTHLAATYHPSRPITKLVVGGGQSTLPGLVEYLSANLNLPVELASVWSNALDPKRVLPPISFNQSQKYATSLGLALRNWQMEFNHGQSS